MRATFDPYAGSQQLIFAFEAVVIGGAGSLWGTLWGGIALGVAQNLGSQVSPRGFLIAGHLIFIVILAFRIFAGGVDLARVGEAEAAPAMSAAEKFVVQRWTPVSIVAIVCVVALIVALAFGPFYLSPYLTDRFTTLFIYVLMAAMWNALAGYGGLVSVGHQAFFGLGAYAAIRLSYWGVEPYTAFLLGSLIVGALALPLSPLALRLRGGEFAIGMWVLAELAHLLVNLDPRVNGETGISMIALDAYDATARSATTTGARLPP